MAASSSLMQPSKAPQPAAPALAVVAAAGTGVQAEPEQYSLRQGHRALGEVVDRYELANKLEELLTGNQKEHFARLAVDLYDITLTNNYAEILRTYKRRDITGQFESHEWNSVIVIFWWLLSKRGGTTLKDVYDLLIKVVPSAKRRIEELLSGPQLFLEDTT